MPRLALTMDNNPANSNSPRRSGLLCSNQWVAIKQGDDVIRNGEFDLSQVPNLDFSKPVTETPICTTCGAQPPFEPKIVETLDGPILLCSKCELLNPDPK